MCQLRFLVDWESGVAKISNRASITHATSRQNDDGYHGEKIDIRATLAEIKAAAPRHGWSSEIFHSQAGFDLSALTRRAAPKSAPATRIYLSTGIHGDEPAGPLAALRLIRENRWPDQAEVILLPCLNPLGFANNRRENAQGLDLNRDYLNSQSPEIARTSRGWKSNRPSTCVYASTRIGSHMVSTSMS